MNLLEFYDWALPRVRISAEIPDGFDSPCMVWLGAADNKQTLPRAVMERGGYPVSVRRVAWRALNENAPLHKADGIVPACECALCIEPAHQARRLASDMRRGPKSLLTRLRMAEAARRSRSRVDLQRLQELKDDTRSATVIAAERGLGEDVVRNIRSGRWDTPGNNPFAMLVRRA